MDKLISKNSFYILVTWLFIFGLHNAQFIFAEWFNNDPKTHITPFAYKAPFSLSEDNINYACMTRYASKNPNLYVTDGVIKENKDQQFAIGHIVIVYLGLVHKIIGDITLTYYFGGLFPLLASVFLIFRIIKVFFQKHAIPIAIGTSFIILCSNFDDLFGIYKFLDGYLFPENYHGDLLIYGYSQRFVYSQSSIPFFLFWIYRFILYRKISSNKNQAYLVLSLLGLQYAYFYYWTYAIPILIAVIILDKKKIKEWLLVVGFYLLGSAHYWYETYCFSQLDIYDEYQEKMQGVETFPMFWILVFGTLSILPFLKKGNRLLNILVAITPIFTHLLVEVINYNLQPFHPLYTFFKFIIPTSLIFLGILVSFINKWGPVAILSLSNYYLIILLCSLKFIIGFNIQPYHWVYTAFFPLLIITLLLTWKDFIKSIWIKKTVLLSASIIIIFGILNSLKIANFNHKFWTIHDDEIEVIKYLENYPYTVIAGNNMMPLITLMAHTDLYLYEGMTCNKISSYEESAQRFIHPYKLMGYKKTEILQEYKKYEMISEYHTIYVKGSEANRDSLAKAYPDNLLGSIEGMWHYFTSPSKYLTKFENSLTNYADPQFALDYLVIYKPTFKGDTSYILGEKKVENESFIVYSLNKNL